MYIISIYKNNRKKYKINRRGERRELKMRVIIILIIPFKFYSFIFCRFVYLV